MRLSTRGGWVVALLVVSALLSPPTTATADSFRVSEPSEVDPVLTVEVPGPIALRDLSPATLDVIAERSNVAVPDLDQVLADPTSLVTVTGMIVHREAVPEAPGQPDPSIVQVDTSSTYALHGRPGAKRVIFLDFGGTEPVDAGWSITAGAPVFSADNDPGLTMDEHVAIHRVWARVAEDFAPFDVDVTTEDPGSARLMREGLSDDTYGIRIVFTQGTESRKELCGESTCSATGYFNTFTDNPIEAAGDLLIDGWIFADTVGHDARVLADLASHQAGHSMGLTHDGTEDSPYYGGHENWGPIMGLPSGREITQWSAGEYDGANNQEDDLTIIAAKLPLLEDDHGDTIQSAIHRGHLPVYRATGIITSRDDLDLVRIDTSTCAEDFTFKVRPAEVGPNLDIRVRILNESNYNVIYPQGDASSLSGPLTGMDVEFTRGLRPGIYYVVVEGVGEHDPGSTGYSKYGSLGRWNLEVTACPDATGQAVPPARPHGVATRIDQADMTVTVLWTPNSIDGGAPIDGHVVQLGDREPVFVPAPALSYTFGDIPESTPMHVSVRSHNRAGDGEPHETSVIGFKQLSSPPRNLRIISVPERPGSVVLTWDPPEHPRRDIDYYCISFYVTDFCRTHHGTSMRIDGVTSGETLLVHLQAHTSAGPGLPYTTSIVVPAPIRTPAPARRLKVTHRTATTMYLVWTNPDPKIATNFQPDSYRVVLDGKTVMTVPHNQRGFELTGLRPGKTYRLAIISVLDGRKSAAVGVRMATLTAAPTPPRTGRATSGTKGGAITATAKWGEPLSRGGLAITSYRVTATRLNADGRVLSRHTFTAKASARSLTMTLPKAGSYRFNVVAINRKGTSRPSTNSRIVTAR